MSILLIMTVVKLTAHLFGTLYLLQESMEFPGFCVQRSTHCLVVTGGVRQAGKMSRAQLQDRECSRGTVSAHLADSLVDQMKRMLRIFF